MAAPLIATTPNPNLTPGLGSTTNPTSFTSATDPSQTLALPQQAAQPAAPTSAPLIQLPPELQGMPISPPPAIAQQGVQQAQQAQQQTQQAPQEPPQQPQPNQTMMLAAAKKAAEDRRLAQIAAFNQNRSNA